jgi:thiamine-monophosphate kinase
MGERAPTEAAILERLKRRIGRPRASRVVKGIGDDCAIYRSPGSAEDLLLTTDLLIEGVHFLTSTHRPADIGHKTLARGLSDIAAMGGEPRFCLLSLALPPSTTARWIDSFYTGLLKLADAHGAVLAGGDLARADRITCDIVCGGAVPRGEALLRSGAKPGDIIYVSGALGGSALGLASDRGPARLRHLRPMPRLELGRHLRGQLRATAAMDLSDGLSIDLARLCEASGTSANIETVPRFHGATLQQALHGGEDYELLFTVRPVTRVPARFRGIPLTRIGTMLDGPARGSDSRVSFAGEPLPVLGYDHFRT